MALLIRDGKIVLKNGALLIANNGANNCCCDDDCPFPCDENIICPDPFGDGRNRCSNGCCVGVATCCVGGRSFDFNGQPFVNDGPGQCALAGGIFFTGLFPHEVNGGNGCHASCCDRIVGFDINGNPIVETERIEDGRTQPVACPQCDACCSDLVDLVDGDCPPTHPNQVGNKCNSCGPNANCVVCGGWIADCGPVQNQ
jgi:hypothetical protein